MGARVDPRATLALLFTTTLALAGSLAPVDDYPYCSVPPYVDIRTVPPDLTPPPMLRGPPPTAGARVLATLPGWAPADSQAYFSLYLPPEWNSSTRLPVVVELAGNGPYLSPYGDVSTGHPEGSSLGWGLTAGTGAIWVCAPMLTAGGDFVETQWWGCPLQAGGMFSDDSPPTYTPPGGGCGAAATNTSRAIAYLTAVTRYVTAAFGGDPERVVLIGFSRGAIGVNYLGLADDDIASLWAGSIAYAHYDGQPEDTKWPYPAPGPPASYERLRRLGARPQFVCCELNNSEAETRVRSVLEGGGSGAPRSEASVLSAPPFFAFQPYIQAAGFPVNATFTSTGFCNHDDKWALRPSAARTAMRAWFAGVVGDSGRRSPEGA